MKLDQIAFIAFDDDDERRIKEALGLENEKWVEDVVTATGLVRGRTKTNVAKLQFNYSRGTEIEILRYTSGDNYAKDLVPGSMCHFGHHLEDGEEFDLPNAPIIQQVVTQSHTNPFLLENGRRYCYTIFDTYGDLGVYFKVIQRIEDATMAEELLGQIGGQRVR